MQRKMSLYLVIVMMGLVMDWQCEFCPAKCMQCYAISRRPSHATDNLQCEGEWELCKWMRMDVLSRIFMKNGLVKVKIPCVQPEAFHLYRQG
jgi:hypothetical protein